MARESIPGWDPITWIYKEWVKTPPRQGAVVVEVGVALGRSITWIADWCIANNRRDIEVWAVDPWESSLPGNVRNGEQATYAAQAGGDFSLYTKMLLEHDPAAYEFIRPIRATSERACSLFPPGSVDLIVIDGDHSYDGCSTDIACWWPRMRADGWIGGDDHHDTDWPGVVRACRETFGAGGYEVIKGMATGWETGTVWLKRPTR
jgi:hypothetical protein